MKKIFLSILAVFLLSSLCFAETIIFKDGHKAEGKIVEKTDEYIKVYYDKDVTITWSLDKIESIDGIAVIPSSRIKIAEEAIKNNDVLEVKKAIDKGADVNAKERDGTTALKIAEARGSNEMVALLKKYGAK